MEQGHAHFDVSRCSCSTRPTACSTWASSTRSAASSRRCRGKRQNLIFSATMPQEIAQLADRILVNPVDVAVTPVVQHGGADRPVGPARRPRRQARAPARGAARPDDDARAGLHPHEARRQPRRRGARPRRRPRRRHSRQQVAGRPRARAGFVQARARIRVLVATDIAARGIDVDGISHVDQLRASRWSRRATSTASAAPRARARPAWRCRSASPRSATPCAPSNGSRGRRCAWSMTILLRGNVGPTAVHTA